MFDFIKSDADKLGYLQLSQTIVSAVETGRLPANTPLPPSRVLAESLGVSRDTVLRSFRHLQALGVVESHGTRGTFISDKAQALSSAPDVRPIDPSRLSSFGRHMTSESRPHHFPAEILNYGAVPKECLPIRRWKLATQKHSQTVSLRDIEYETEVLGRIELRSAVAAFVNQSRGIACGVDEVAIFNIAFNAMTLVCRLILEPGDLIAMEDPGYAGLRDVADYLGFQTVAIPWDTEGLSVDALERYGNRIKLVYVSGCHQEPLGNPMTLARRKQLLSWAQKNNAWILEDDYDSTFHYGLSTPPTLKSMDTQDNVIYLSNFWQVLFPLTTLCYTVVPPSLMAALQRAKQQTASLTEALTQMALAEILNDGYLQKHTRKLERVFASRRRTLIYELKRNFGANVHIPTYTGGLTMMVRFEQFTDEELIEASRKAEFAMVQSSPFYSDRHVPGEYLIYFAGLEETATRRKIANMAAHLNGAEIALEHHR